MRTLFWIILSLGLGGWLATARADTFQLSDGTSVSGDIILFNDAGITLRTPSDSYTNVVWPKFSQATLKQLSQQNSKIKSLAELFIETPPAQPQSAKVTVQEVSRLKLPRKESLLVALITSSVGFIALLLIYAANVYAAYEIALLRARPIGLVMGVAAVLPVLGPVIFLALPIQESGPDAGQPQAEHAFTVPAGAAPVAESIAAAGIHISPATGARPAHPEAQVFQRGQFMFNRRFFETKFSGFFGVIRRPAEKDLVLVVKTARAQLVVQRISRIATNEAHFEVLQGGARQEIMVPFADIQEIQIKHKDA
ncbi:MAG: hypothetical protein WBN22_11610 [Verrucomicrobiia bacterium]